jgi:hypothetical protein
MSTGARPHALQLLEVGGLASLVRPLPIPFPVQSPPILGKTYQECSPGRQEEGSTQKQKEKEERNVRENPVAQAPEVTAIW